jgi:hypothetical protein
MEVSNLSKKTYAWCLENANLLLCVRVPTSRYSLVLELSNVAIWWSPTNPIKNSLFGTVCRLQTVNVAWQQKAKEKKR